VRLRHWVDDVIPVQGLCLFAWPDADTDRCAELVMAQHLVKDAEQQRVGRGRIEDTGLGEQRVDPLRSESLE
jgi:hypothetical protein